MNNDAQKILKIVEKIHHPQNCSVVKMVENSIEKQLRKKPDIWGDGYDDNGNLIYDSWKCPCCQSEYELDYDEYNYCPNCGQAIDWSDYTNS